MGGAPVRHPPPKAAAASVVAAAVGASVGPEPDCHRRPRKMVVASVEEMAVGG